MGNGASASSKVAPASPNKIVEETKASFMAAPVLDDVGEEAKADAKANSKQLKKLALGQQGYMDQHREYDAALAKITTNKAVNESKWDENSKRKVEGSASRQQFTMNDIGKMQNQGRNVTSPPIVASIASTQQQSSVRPPPPRQPPPVINKPQMPVHHSQGPPQGGRRISSPAPPIDAPYAPPHYAGGPRNTGGSAGGGGGGNNSRGGERQRPQKKPKPEQPRRYIVREPSIKSKLTETQAKYNKPVAEYSDDSESDEESSVGEGGAAKGDGDDVYDWIDGGEPGVSAPSSQTPSVTKKKETSVTVQSIGPPQGGRPSSGALTDLSLRVDTCSSASAAGSHGNSTTAIMLTKEGDSDNCTMANFADEDDAKSTTPYNRPSKVPVLEMASLSNSPMSAPQYRTVDVASTYHSNPNGGSGAHYNQGGPKPPPPKVSISPMKRTAMPDINNCHPSPQHGAPRVSTGSPGHGSPHQCAGQQFRSSGPNPLANSVESAVSNVGNAMRGSGNGGIGISVTMSTDGLPSSIYATPMGTRDAMTPNGAGGSSSVSGTPHVPSTTSRTMGVRATPPPKPTKSIMPHAVKETTDVKRNKIQLPTNLQHAKPTAGDWLKKRYIVNNYILLDTLGTGSYGEVRLCKDRTTEKLFAIKIISRDLLKKKKHGHNSETFFEDIRREIAIMKKLMHPNVLRLYEVLDDNNVNKMYLVLEYMKRGDLITLLERDQASADASGASAHSPITSADANDSTKKSTGSKTKTMTPLPECEVWNIFRQVAAGIRYLHYQNVVHGDIKPQNLLVSETGIIKIADFGISKMMSDNSEKMTDGAGTPAFMSPELCAGKAFSGQLADVWALGATMFMLKYGSPPWISNNVIALYNKIQNDPLVFPAAPSIDPGLKDLLSHMMEKDPVKRCNIQQVLQHPWFRQPPPPPTKSRATSQSAARNSSSGVTSPVPSQATGASSGQSSSVISPVAPPGGMSFAPPQSYDQEQADAMKGPLVTETVNEEEMYMSIGLRYNNKNKSTKDKTAPNDGGNSEAQEAVAAVGAADARIDEEDDIFKTNVDDFDDDDDDDDDSGREESGAQNAKADKVFSGITEGNENEESGGDLMATNWGDDVFQMVDDDGDGECDDDGDDDDEDDAIPGKNTGKTDEMNTTESAPAGASSNSMSSTVHTEMTAEEEERRVMKFKKKNKQKSTASLITASMIAKKIDHVSERGGGDLDYLNDDDDVIQLDGYEGPVDRGNKKDSALVKKPPSIASVMENKKKSPQSLKHLSVSSPTSTVDSTENTPSRSRRSSKTPYQKSGFRKSTKDGNSSQYDDDEDEDEVIEPISMSEFANIMDTLARQPKDDTNGDSAAEELPVVHMLLNKRKLQALQSNSHNDTKIAFHSEQGVRTGQEDRCVVVPNVAKLPQFSGNVASSGKRYPPLEDDVKQQLHKFSIVCVFDGHNGSTISEYLHEHFVETLLSTGCGKLLSNNPRVLSNLLVNTCQDIDDKMCRNMREEDDAAGSTGIVALYDGRKHVLTVANVGDSSCVLCDSSGKAIRVLTMHRLSNKSERDRVSKTESQILNNRINGVLAVSRAFGDIPFKDHDETTGHLKLSTNGVVATPDIYSEKIPLSMEFAVMGTDGLFDVMDDQTVINYVRRCLQRKADLQYTATELTKEAISRGSVDNVTAAIIVFHSSSES